MLKNYIFGDQANRTGAEAITWNPDSQMSVNPHMLICGGSGAGKTRLLLDIIRYLNEANKHIFIFDLKGDMVVTDDKGNEIGNKINFTSWDSEYGISPFEFDTGVSEPELKFIIQSGDKTQEQDFKIKNSGPKVQVERIIEIVKKNFLPNMGTFQKDMLTYLFSDTYILKGFKYNNVNTWTKELPSLEDTLELIGRIKSHVDSGSQSTMDDGSVELIAEIQKRILGLQSLKNREDDSDEVVNKIALLQKEIDEEVTKYVTYGIENYTEISISEDREWFAHYGIDIEKYLSKKAYSTIETLASYINALVESGVFHSKRPPVKNGLNIINISGLDVSIQKFIVDVWLGKVFKSCKIRGTYADRKNKDRGEKCDTYVVVDESKLISGTGREKNDPFSYLNRTATEARSFGFALIVASQSAEHFPPEFLKNFDSQVILKTGIADFDAVRKSFGIDKQMLEFTQIKWGNALVKTGRKFNKVILKQD